MHLPHLLPDWTLLESVRSAHTWLEAESIIFFVLLALSEIVAHEIEEDRRQKRIHQIGLFFFGVAVLAEGAAFLYGQRNDTLSESLTAELRVRISETNKTAAEAGERAANAEERAAGAQERAAEAESRIAEANLQASQLEKEAARLRKDAEEERLARVRIEQQVAWRHIDQATHDKAVKMLLPFSGTTILLNAAEYPSNPHSDAETNAYKRQVWAIFHDAHWDVAGGDGGIPLRAGTFCSINYRHPAALTLIQVFMLLPGPFYPRNDMPLAPKDVAYCEINFKQP